MGALPADMVNAFGGVSDPFSCFSHLVAALCFLVAGVALVSRGRGAPHRLISLGVFVIATVLLLTVSGLYHWFERGSVTREVFRRIDHASIFILIAATFTPVHTILFRGIGRWGMIALVWTAAIVALVIKVVFFTAIPDAVGSIMYLALGWLGLISGVMLWRRFGALSMTPILLGGVAYSIGAVIELNNQLTLIQGIIHAHEVFHLAVIVGLASHWTFMFRCAEGESPHPYRDGRRGQSPGSRSGSGSATSIETSTAAGLQ